MIIQPYAFKGDDFEYVYAQARKFCARLHDAGLSVSLSDGFRSNTKSYPDYDRSVTIIEVFPDIAVAEQIETAEKIFADVMKPEPPVEDEYITEAHRIIKQLPLLLKQNKDGWKLTDTSGDCYISWDLSDTDTKQVLEHTHKIVCIVTGANPETTKPDLLVIPG